MKHLNCLFVMSTAVITLFSPILGGCDHAPDTIKIGIARPLSGGRAAPSKDQANGVELAINVLKQAGFKVHSEVITLKMVDVDDKANPEEGVRIALQLVDAGVVAVVGHFNFDVSIPIAPIYASKDITRLAISSKSKFTRLGHGSALRLVANDELQACSVGSFASWLSSER